MEGGRFIFEFICNVDSVCKAVNEDRILHFSDRLVGSLLRIHWKLQTPRKCTHHIFHFQFQGVLIHPWDLLEARLRML